MGGRKAARVQSRMVCQAASWLGWSRRSSFRNEAKGPSGVSERTGSGRICWTWLKRKVVRLGLMVQPERVTAACQARRGVEGQDDGGLGGVGEMVEGSGSAVVVVADDGGPIVRVPGGAEVDARRPGVEEATAFHGSEAVADLTDGRERDAEFGAAVEDPVLHGWGFDGVVVVGGARDTRDAGEGLSGFRD